MASTGDEAVDRGGRIDERSCAFRLGTLTTALRLASDTAASSDTPWNSGSIHRVPVVNVSCSPLMPHASAYRAMNVPQTFGRPFSCEAPKNTAAIAGNR